MLRRTNDILQVVQVSRAYDRRGDTLLGEDPRDRELRHFYALLLRQLLEPAGGQVVADRSTR